MQKNDLIFYLSGDPFQYGGGATVSYNVLKMVSESLNRPILMVSRAAEIPQEIKSGVNLVRLPMPKNRILAELFDQLIAPIILLFYFPKRVVCLNSIVPLLYPRRIDLFFQMRMFYFEELDSVSKKIKNFLGRLSAKRADNLYCASKDHAKDMCNKLNLENAKVKVIHLGFDMKASVDVALKRTDSLLFVSVIRPYKNLHGLIDAVIEAKQERPDLPIHLDIIGKPADYVGIDSYMKGLNLKIKQSELSDCFNFVGAQEHRVVLEYLSNCKALVFPTQFEGFGLPLLEAMATKCPVICSDVNSLPEIGADTVEYFDVNESSSLAQKIIELYDLGYEPKKIKDAYSRAGKFNWKNTAEAILNNQEFKVN